MNSTMVSWVGSIIGKATDYIAKILEAFGYKAAGVTTQQALKHSAKSFGAASAITAGMESNAAKKGISAIGSYARNALGMASS